MIPTPRPGPGVWPPDADLLDGIAVAAAALAVDGTVVGANAAGARLFGSGTGPDDAVAEVLALALRSGSWTGELEVQVDDGRHVVLSTVWTAFLHGDEPVGALVLAEEVAAASAVPLTVTATEHQLGRRLHRFAAVISELLMAESVEAVAKVVTEHLTDAAGATLGSFSLLVDDETLALVGIRGGREGVASRWATYPLASNTPAAEALRAAEPLVLVGREELARRYPDLENAAEGERSMVCLPLLARGRRLGVVTLSFPTLWNGGDAEMLFLRLLSDTCAVTLDRVDAQAAARDREAKLTFLAEMSAGLAADLDYEATLAAVAQAAIGWFADWCTISLAEDGVLRTIAVAHAQPHHDQLVRDLIERYPPQPGDGSYAVLESGHSVLAPEVTDDLLRAGSRDPEHYAMMRRLELRSGLSCALKVGDRTFGVITWVTGEHGRRFSPSDRAFGENLAQRAAVAIDNAQLHSQVRDVALRLQQAVLPDRLPETPGWTTAVRYQPSGRTDAGGDFYDVLPLPDGRLALFVGDVMGRGVPAASVMAQMRSAIRTLAAVDPTPSAVLAGMDRVFEILHVDQLVTMVYGLVDPGRDRLEVVNAGHPPPLLIPADGPVTLLETDGTLLLGAGGGDRGVREVPFGPGDGLLLYTDGLVERRAEHPDVGTDRLVAAVGSPPVGSPPGDEAQEWLTALVEAIRDPTRDDDVAALLVRRTPAPGLPR